MSRVIAPLVLACGLGGCEEKVRYDDVPVSTSSRKKAEKKEIPRQKFDHGVLCTRLFSLLDVANVGGGTVPADELTVREDACRQQLDALEGGRPDEHDCRCRCIGTAKDFAELETCAPRCETDADTICARAATLLGQSNDAGVLDHLYDECRTRLDPLVESDVARYRCFVSCYLAATDTKAATNCVETCEPPEPRK